MVDARRDSYESSMRGLQHFEEGRNLSRGVAEFHWETQKVTRELVWKA